MPNLKHPYKIPTKKILASDFSLFCLTSLGVSPAKIRSDIDNWIAEDTGHGDITVAGIVNSSSVATAYIVAKQKFSLAGLPIIAEIFRRICGENIAVFSAFSDGDTVNPGDVVIAATGCTAGLLIAERTSLNFGCRISGVCTKTKSISEAISNDKQGSKLVLLETRKTTPGLRLYEKYATRVGGARNHRHGLDAGAMLKENHLRALGGINNAINMVKNRLPILSKLEVEVTNIQEFHTAAQAGAEIIMLDNFSASDIKQAVAERDAAYPTVLLEVSGNLDGDKLNLILNSGVDFASMGALIHKANWVDMSLQLYLN